MAISNFIPELWSPELLVNLWEQMIYAGLCNRDYEGEVQRAGDTVHITSFGKPTISTYTKYGTLTYEQLTDADRELLIDQAKSFSFGVDDVDKRQAAGDFVANAMRDAAMGLAEASDQYVAAALKAAVDGTANDIGAVSDSLTTNNLYGDVLVEMRTLLNRSNCPKVGRWAVLPPEVFGDLLQDSRFINAQASADAGVALHEGAIGRIAGFDVFESNNVPTDTAGVYDVIAGHPIACTYADQIVDTEAVRLIDYIGDGIRGLHVYGAKVTRPECLAMASVTPA